MGASTDNTAGVFSFTTALVSGRVAVAHEGRPVSVKSEVGTLLVRNHDPTETLVRCNAGPRSQTRTCTRIDRLSPSPNPRIRSTQVSEGNPSGVIVPAPRITALYGDSPGIDFAGSGRKQRFCRRSARSLRNRIGLLPGAYHRKSPMKIFMSTLIEYQHDSIEQCAATHGWDSEVVVLHPSDLH